MYRDILKRVSALSIIGLCCCTIAAAAPIHYFPFDNPSPLVDEGLPYNANINGTTGTWYPHAASLETHAVSSATGRFGYGVYIPTGPDGTYKGSVIVGTGTQGTSGDGTLPCPPITISMWFYPLELPTGTGNKFIIANAQTSNDNDRCYMTMRATGGSVYLTGHVGMYETTVTTTNTISLNTWHHAFMTITRAGDYRAAITLVLDGGTPATTTADVSWDPALFDLCSKRLGTYGAGIESGKTLYGYVDDFAVWNQALPAAQATFMWNGGAGRRANVGDGKCAYDPTPADKSVGNSGTAQLKWYNALRLTTTSTSDVYFSTNKADLVNTYNQPLFPAAKKIATAVAGTSGAQSSAAVSIPQGIDTFYWMVATKTSNPSDPNNVNGYAGPVWTFDVSNAAPQVNAGDDKYTYAGAGTIVLSGTVTDDGLPEGASVTCVWKQGTTPLTTSVVKTGNSYACTTSVTAGAAGTSTTYTLEGNDTTGTGSDTVDVKVYATPCLAAQANPNYSMVKYAGDINSDCFVDFKDFALTVSKWKVCTALDAVCP